jgi:hypothetical protein
MDGDYRLGSRRDGLFDLAAIDIEVLPTSTKTGVAPTFTTADAVATKVWAGTITSSPLPIPAARSDMWRAS